MLQDVDLAYRGGVLASNRALAVGTPPGAVAPLVLPAGYLNSAKPTGLILPSSYPSDDVSGGTDGTARINLYSYQRANFYSFGEVMRIFGMRKDSKQMLAWYAPTLGYDGTTRDPVAGTSWKPVTWIGSHWESNGHTGNHKHWEVEIPASDGSLQGRVLIPFGSPGDESIGLDKTKVEINLADLVVHSTGTNPVDGTLMHMVFRLAGASGNEQAIEFAADTDGVVRFWKMRVTGDTNSDLQFARYDNSGSFLDSPVTVVRSSGQVQVGGAGGLLVSRNSGVALTVTPTATGGQGTLVTGTDATATAYAGNVSGDATNRFRAYVDGKHEWGDGTTARDTNLYRSAADTLKTDDSLVIAGTLTVGGAPVTGDRNVAGPADNGLKAWSFDPASASATTGITSGTLYLTAIFVRAPITITKLWYGMGTAATSPVAGQNFVGLFSSAGTLLASAGIDTQVTGTNGPQNVTITSTALAAGCYWFGILQNAATPQALVRSAPAFGALSNVNLSSATFRAAVNGTGLTAMPSSITLASNSQSGASHLWAAVS